MKNVLEEQLTERAKTDEKIRILEEKLNYVGTYALDAICLLDVV